MMTRVRKTAPKSEVSFEPKGNQLAARPFAQRAEVHEATMGESRVSFSLDDIDIFPRKSVQARLTHEVQQKNGAALQGKMLESREVIQEKEEAPLNRTGMPDHLKSGIEMLSGMNLSDVRVHYDSAKPVQLNALAYTQGQEIHVAPGQERHLPHEAWHAVQQMQGRVKPTIRTKEALLANDDEGLEREADVMGTKAAKSPICVNSCPNLMKTRTTVGQFRQVVQYKVGFEFEDAYWRPWQQGYFNRIYPAERKAKLHSGTNFNLEADDTPGPKASNLEFVTDPFEESADGLVRLQHTLGEILALGTRLNGLVGARGPENADENPPYYFTSDRFVSQNRHRLTGPAYGGGRWLHLSGGINGWRIKMQATSGIALSDIPLIMKYFGSNVAGETIPEAVERNPARIALVGATDPANDDTLKVIGGSPQVAEVAANNIRTDGRITPDLAALFAAGISTELVGFLSAMVLTLKMLQLPIRGVLKYRIPLMLRTNFARLFNALPVGTPIALRNNPQVLIDGLINASNAHVLLPTYQGIDPDTALTANSPLIRSPRRFTYSPNAPQPHEALAGITIGMWIQGILDGKDLLTPETADTWLKNQGWWWWSRKEKVELFESFNSVDEMDYSPGPGRQLGIFENRSIAPRGAEGYLTLEEASRMAWNQLLFYKRIEDSHGPGNPPVGQYPDNDIGVE